MLTTRLVTIAATVLAVGGVARAQHHHHHHHHHGSGDDGGEEMAAAAPSVHLHAMLSVESGSVDAFAGERDYQGAILMMGARRGAFELMGHVPFYRIQLGGNSGTGLGDVHVEGRWVALSAGRTEVGLSAGAMPPFADDDQGLGMGHWMIMAGGFARASRGQLSGQLSVGYGGALGGHGHSEHGVDVWPPVSPMNAHELTTKLGAAIAIAGGVGLDLALHTGTPLGDGAFLGIAGGGVTYDLGRFRLGAGARHGFAGHTADLVLSSYVMASF